MREEVVLPHAASGWRIHCGVEVTELSTNKQQQMPLDCLRNKTDRTNAFRFKRAAFYMGLKSKVGLVTAKASALRINLNIQGCSVVAPPLHAPSHAPFPLPLLLHTISLSPAVTSA